MWVAATHFGSLPFYWDYCAMAKVKSLISSIPLRTWGEFKKLVENQGVQDNDVLYEIDVGPNNNRLNIIVDDLIDSFGYYPIKPVRERSSMIKKRTIVINDNSYEDNM